MWRTALLVFVFAFIAGTGFAAGVKAFSSAADLVADATRGTTPSTTSVADYEALIRQPGRP
jgi:hypothetical protein